MIEEIILLVEKVYVLILYSERVELSEDLKNEILKYNFNIIVLESYEEVLKFVLSELKEDDLILVSGLLYMIGDMRKIINLIIN